MSEFEIQAEEGIQSNICLMLKDLLSKEDLNESFSSSCDEFEETEGQLSYKQEQSDNSDSQNSQQHYTTILTFQNVHPNTYQANGFNRRNKENYQKKLNTNINNLPYKHFNNYFNQQQAVNGNVSSIPFEKTFQTPNQKSNSSHYVTTFEQTSPKQIQTETTQYFNQTYFSHLEFLLGKTKKIDKFIYSQISGNIKTILSNSKGCKILQNYLPNTNLEIISLIFQEIQNSIISLSTMSHTHHFLLKLYDFIPFQLKLSLLQILSNHLLLISTHNVSTYFIQNIIEKLHSYEEQKYIISVINPIKKELALDKYGTYVIEKIISFFNYNLIDELLLFIVNNFVLLACNSYGLCIIKKAIILENSPFDKKYHNLIKQIIIENNLNLIQNPYGNYAIQTALTNWNDSFEIAQCVDNKIVFLSLQKYASNVIEKCFEKYHPCLTKFIYSLNLYGQETEILKMLQNPFSTYVLIKAIKLCSNKHEYQLLRDIIIIGLTKLNDKKLFTKWKKILIL